MAVREKSAGVILIREHGNQRFVLFLKHENEYMDFPKGHVERGESDEDAARREVKEETGITDLQTVPGFKEKIEYFYRREGQLIAKEVVYVLARTRSELVTISSEHVGFEWMRVEDALQRASFKNQKDLLEKALKFLSQKRGLEKFI